MLVRAKITGNTVLFFYCTLCPLVKLGRAKVAENASRLSSYYSDPFVDRTSVIRGSNLVAASRALAKALKSASIM